MSQPNNKKRLKIALDSIKNELEKISSSVPSIEFIQVTYNLLLHAELLTRGLVVDTNARSSFDNVEHLHEGIRTCVGKVRLSMEQHEIEGYPIPLLAATFAVCGLAAEQLHRQLKFCNDEGELISGAIFKDSIPNDILERSKSVKDSYFDSVLGLYGKGNSVNRSVTCAELSIEALQLSQERYMYAAQTFMRDQPQMWRKVHDTMFQIHQWINRNDESRYMVNRLFPPSDAVVSLENLVRIFREKGNSKKQLEFSVYLAGALLSTKSIVTGHSQKMIAPRIEKAESIIQVCKESHSLDRMHLLFVKVIASYIEILKEDEEIEIVSKEVNDSRKAIDKVYCDESNKGGDELYGGSYHLRDTLIQFIIHSEQTDEHNEISECLSRSSSLILEEYINRFINRIHSVSAKISRIRKKNVDKTTSVTITLEKARKEFITKLHFLVKPLLQSYVKDDFDSLHSVSRFDITIELVRKCARALMHLVWINSQGENLFKDDCYLVSSSLKLLVKNVKGSVTFLDTAIYSYIDIFDQNGSSLNRNQMIDDFYHILKDEKELDDSASCYGLSFYECLILWNGYSSGRPWSFSNISEARLTKAKAERDVTTSLTKFGRPYSIFDQSVLDLSEADFELYLPGGNAERSFILYNKILRNMDGELHEELSLDLRDFIMAYCLRGLSVVVLDHQTISSKLIDISVYKYAESSVSQAMAIVEKWVSKATLLSNVEIYSTYLLKSLRKNLPNQIRHQVANVFVESNKADSAISFLINVIENNPDDSEAKLSLGSVYLKRFAVNNDPIEKKLSQQILLEAAKLNPKNADTFSLLGYWFEIVGDNGRAIGCYTKALTLDPCHPVAGRGISRLLQYSHVKKLCSDAVSITSSVVGWAWEYLGEGAINEANNYEIAATCFQEALRMNDIASNVRQSLSFFYTHPKIRTNIIDSESSLWAQLAECYRRLGKFSAAIRAYSNAALVTNESLKTSILCKWAQVEIELGLIKEAYIRYESVLSIDSNCYDAAFGLARTSLLLARVACDEGKCSQSYRFILSGIRILEENFENKSCRFLSVLKCLGDLYSFAYFLPSSLFVKESNNFMACEHKNFISRGEESYRKAIQMVPEFISNEKGVGDELLTSLYCDMGSNQFMQSQILYEGEFKGISQINRREPCSDDIVWKTMLQNSINSFLSSIDIDFSFAPAWGGVGIALSFVDPILSQHCLARSVELDKSGVDIWGNYALCCFDVKAELACVESLDALTQVADSPIIWIGRGLLLESKGRQEVENSWQIAMRKAADAYRTALQVSHEPSALLGLAMTCRHTQDISSRENLDAFEVAAKSFEQQEFYASIRSYCALKCGSDKFTKSIEISSILEETQYSSSLVSIQNLIDEAKLLSNRLNDLINMKTCEEDENYIYKVASSLIRDVMTSYCPRPVTKCKACATTIGSALIGLHEEPGNVNQWLIFAKSLLRDHAGDDENSERSTRKVIRKVLAATNVCIEVGNESIVNPLRLGSSHAKIGSDETKPNHHDIGPINGRLFERPTTSSLLSEAYAFRHWLYKVENQHILGSDKVQEKRIDLQRSLILDPENKLALESLN